MKRWVEKRAAEVVKIPWQHRSRIGMGLVTQFLDREYRLLCVSVSATHVHILVELPIDAKEARRIVGLCKGTASHAVRDVMPGRIFAEGGSYELILNQEHQANVFDYILYKQGRSAFTWSYKDNQGALIPGRV
ncbi:MAG TPA: hypothetical protein VH518_00075 [Tepidisphaeraceae bacterium]